MHYFFQTINCLHLFTNLYLTAQIMYLLHLQGIPVYTNQLPKCDLNCLFCTFSTTVLSPLQSSPVNLMSNHFKSWTNMGKFWTKKLFQCEQKLWKIWHIKYKHIFSLIYRFILIPLSHCTFIQLLISQFWG